MVGSRPGARAGLILRTWPRGLRNLLILWAGLAFLSPFVIGFAALLVLPFGAPGIIAAGPAQDALLRHLVGASFIFGLPLFLILALDQIRMDWGTWRVAIRRAFRIVGLILVSWLMATASLAAIARFAAPVVANAILSPPVQTWRIEVTVTKLGKSYRRECQKALLFAVPNVSARQLSLCVYPTGPFYTAEAGDILHLTGRAGPFGITYDRASRRLEKVTEVEN